jgi:hypothetical protein
MIGRGIHGIQVEWLSSRIDDVVPRPGWDDERPFGIDIVRLWKIVLRWTCFDLRLPRFNAEKLIDVGMHLETDLTSGFDRHEGQLAVLTRPEHRPKGLILPCPIFNVVGPD